MRFVGKILPLLVACCIIASCANRGIGPQGGPKDETPPVVVKEVPENGAINHTNPVIEVYFDEYIQLDKISENVLISPPQQRPPEVKAVGKRLRVTFDGVLQDSTTYTIDFGSAICDNNEKNPLKGYSFSFATGDMIDSLRISGMILNAEDLNPISGIVVGIHNNLSDTALSTLPFNRITKSATDGNFVVQNIHQGAYRLYGLQDVSNDYVYQAGEGLAIYDSILTPTCHTEEIADTVWVKIDSLYANTALMDSLRAALPYADLTIIDSVLMTLRSIDTIMVKQRTIYEPDSIVMYFFNEQKTRHYFQRAVREKQHQFRLYFGAPQDSLPVIHPIDSLNWLPFTLCQTNQTNDTITYWLTDSAAIAMDTLRFEMTYYRTDSLYNMEQATDTISAIYRAPRLSDKARQAQERNRRNEHVVLKTNSSSSFEIYNPLIIETETPIAHFYPDSLHLYLVVDTTLTPVSFAVEQADSSRMKFLVPFDWKAAGQYKFQFDSAAFTDIYGKVNNRTEGNLTVRSMDEYSSILIKIEPYDDRAVLQLLSEKDEVISQQPAKAEGVKFEYLSPKSYYLRLFIDEDGDGKWTTGDFEKKRQPERVYYFGNKLTLRANWDFEEEFRYLDVPQHKQKPKEIRKDAAAKKK